MNPRSAASGLIISLSVLVACSTGNTHGGSGIPTSETTPEVEISPSPSQVAIPRQEIGSETLLTAGPSSGQEIVGDFSAKKGKHWLLFDCIGSGVAHIQVSGLGTLPITCVDGSTTPTLNELKFATARSIKLAIDAPESVQWALRVTR
ncbi:hypothetical protein ACIBG7_18920 [Nonomuraea sp. NPDC050328]|uniref:hypothetical protein n=1 Tax=Nonomuraea sp. NPDC050328 TaxID=3364361 RepID=UPI0037A9DE67